MILPVAVLGFLAITASRFAETAMEKIYLRQVLPAVEMEEINEHAKDMSMRLTGFLAGQFPATGARNKIIENHKSVDEHWAKYLSQIDLSELDSEQVKLVETIGTVIKKDIQGFVDKSEQALKADNKETVLEILEDEWPIIQMKLLKPMGKLAESQQLSIKSVYEDSKARSHRILNWAFMAILATIVTVIVSLFMVVRTTRSLLASITKIDELGKTVRSESEECSTKTRTLSDGITGTAASLEETASSVEELTSIVKVNSKHVQSAADISAENTANAEVGENKIMGMISTMSEVAASSKKIEEVVHVIDDIAFQINLLALNAAVEAARAGEAGRGFAVVAEAVRNLANRSADSAKQINVLIQDSVEKSQRGQKVANESGEVLKGIVKSIKSVAEINNKIASASEEQLGGLMQISTAVNQIDSLSQANASISESLVGSTNEMADQGKSLQVLVADLLSVVKGGRSSRGKPDPQEY
jgi:methyl-accepting chemotaxis protein